MPFLDLRGECFILLGEWRAEKSLTIEPLPHLAQRLAKQCGRQLLRDRHADGKLVSVDAGWDEPREGAEDDGLTFRQRRLERMLSESDETPDPERALQLKELAAWLAGAREKLTPAERETYDAERRVEEGEAASLDEALGLSEAAARKRRERMRRALGALAAADGLDDLAVRARGGRSARKDRGEGTRGGGEGSDAGG